VQNDDPRTEVLVRVTIPRQIATTCTGDKYHSPLCGNVQNKRGVKYLQPCLTCSPCFQNFPE
jgi:hypothetical protein